MLQFIVASAFLVFGGGAFALIVQMLREDADAILHALGGSPACVPAVQVRARIRSAAMPAPPMRRQQQRAIA